MSSRLTAIMVGALVIALVVAVIAGTLGCGKQQAEDQDDGLREQPEGTVMPPRPDAPASRQAPGGEQERQQRPEQPDEGGEETQ